MNSIYTPMVNVVPPGVVGIAKVDHVVVSEDAARWASIRRERLMAGPLARLFVNGGFMMSDGQNEKLTNWDAVYGAHGEVFIAGLGLGMVLVPILQKPEVNTVTVLEKHADVIALVKECVCLHVKEAACKLRVVEADAFTWKPEKRALWDWIYFDIWADICTDNLTEIMALKRRYARHLNRTNPKAKMSAWVEGQLRSQKRREARYAW